MSQPVNENSESASLRDKAIRLFTYLRELTQLRTTTIRTLDDYESVLWFSEIPREQECFTPAWGVSRENREDIWLEIKKPKLPPVPAVPEQIKRWVNEADLLDATKQKPELLARVLAEIESTPSPASPPEAAPAEPPAPQWLELKDFPEIQTDWNQYIETKWRPWAAEYLRAKRVQKVYSDLFEIYQAQKNLGEEFETAVGFGLLSWESQAGQRIKRHLITVQTSINLDPNKGTLTVSIPADGPRPALEQDMLEASERPDADLQIKIEDLVSRLADDVWNNEFVEVAARSWVQASSAEGQYEGSLEAPASVTKSPFVTYSPALLLRKRTERGLLRVFQEILGQLKDGIDVPLGIARIVDIVDDGNVGAEPNPDGSRFTKLPDEVYFPLPANDEQLKIVQQVESRQGVLVQGPPGTGKSHTIVNLICHLLATGQRVLVTSQTPRALRVLKHKMQSEKSSKELSALCVALLGNDALAIKDLEESVQTITDRHHSWDESQNDNLISRCRNDLRQYREHLADCNAKLRQLREKETFVLDLFDGAYKGTAQQIGQQLGSQKGTLGWIEDEVDEDRGCPVTSDEAVKWLSLRRQIGTEREQEVSQYSIPVEDALTPEQFIKFKEDERVANEIHKNFHELTSDGLFNKIKLSSKDQRKVLADRIDGMLTCQVSLSKNRQRWVADAVVDILSGQQRRWSELYEYSSHRLDGLLERARRLDDHKVEIPKGRDRHGMQGDVIGLLNHLKAGGGFGLPIFRPKPVRKAGYVLKYAKVDGLLCRTVATIALLSDALEVDERLDGLWARWAFVVQRAEGSRAFQVQQVADYCDPLCQLVRLGQLVSEARTAVDAVKGLPQPAWHLADEVSHYRRILDAIESEERLAETKDRFEKLGQVLRAAITRPDHHKLVETGLRAVDTRDETLYGQFHGELLLVAQDRQKLTERQAIEDRLGKSAPQLAATVLGDLGNSAWDSRMESLTTAWGWSRAKAKLEKINSETTVADLLEEIRTTQKKLEISVGHLAASLAWGHCFQRMTKAEQEHLTAWKQAMKRVGKGTGKHAEKHRQEARKNMQGCRTAIPGWIMPLYKVAETVSATPGTFDVAIIDEASQAGPEALFLQFIAKRIVVVGDDMQISPDAVGIPRQEVDLLRDRYLKDFPMPHLGALGVEETSFFHLAEILFGGRIVLNEHFRCMPEIIQFSNALCYRNTLVPLRQYPPNRVKPILQVRHITTGFRKGDTRNPINPPEADALVAAIQQCCENPKYKGKTMGVISLLGEAQAKYVERQLLNAIGPEEIEARRLICGDAYAFQGDERDVIFLSLVAAPGETEMYALTGQKFQRRFNVAASRARDQMWLFHTPSINDFRNKEDLRYQLVSFFHDPKTELNQLDGINIETLERLAARPDRTDQSLPKPFDSWFEIDVFLQLAKRGYRVIPQYEIAGYFIDLVIEGPHGRLAVECDGDEWHGPEQFEADMRRQRILERCGQRFWRIRGSEYYCDPDAAMKSLWSLLDDLEINSPVVTQRSAESSVHHDAGNHVEAVTTLRGSNGNDDDWPSKEANAAARDSRSRYVEAVLSILPRQGKILRADAIRAAAKAMRDAGLIIFQRVRENGELWSDFKSAIHSGIRRGLIDGDARHIWRSDGNGASNAGKTENQ